MNVRSLLYDLKLAGACLLAIGIVGLIWGMG